MDAFVIKMNGALHPAGEHDRELLKLFKPGQPVRVTLRRVRNYEFHCKFMALMRLAFDALPELDEGVRSFDGFRHDIVILTGHHTSYVRLDGSIRYEAKSLSFDTMPEDEFEEIFTAAIDVVMEKVMKKYARNYTAETLRSIVDQVEAFE